MDDLEEKYEYNRELLSNPEHKLRGITRSDDDTMVKTVTTDDELSGKISRLRGDTA